MDLVDIKRKAEAARRFVVQSDGRSFTLQLPTPHETKVEAVRARMHEGDTDPAQLTVLTRRLLERGVVAWSGVTCEQLAPGGGTDAAEISPEAVSLLLDADQVLAEVLENAFIAQLADRNAKRAEAAKN